MTFLRIELQQTFSKKIALIFGVFFLVQLLVGGFLMWEVAHRETVNQLNTVAKRVNDDLVLKNGTWDTQRYNADPNLPDTYPLYIFGNDGFVIDRWKPIHGFLDTSDTKKLLAYQSPQTIHTDTNQTWRMLSQPIKQHEQTLGVITVAYFNPVANDIQTIDEKLQQNLLFIASKVTITPKQTIQTSQLDVRDVSYDISFQIVDQYNTIITKNNNTNSIDRIPNFIDTSYVGDILHAPSLQEIKDSQTGERFLLLTKPIVNNQNYVTGTIVVGKSISFIIDILRNYFLIEGVIGLFISIAGYLGILFLAHDYAAHFDHTLEEKHDVQVIHFDKKSGILSLDHIEITLPYATNQYYLCEALFSAPKKHWEVDELLEKFGEVDSTNWRKVYDAMTIINKKVVQIIDTKLIVVRNKTYQINPLLASKLN